MLNISMVLIPGGPFRMGSLKSEVGRLGDEGPQHKVNVPEFFMSKYLITQVQWKEVADLPKIDRDLKPDPAYFKGYNRPVEQVSWDEAQEFCARLSKHTGRQYRLPSEAEWEYACRAGTTTPYWCGEELTPEMANFDSSGTTHVGLYPPNPFGLYDMHGNVWEWCLDHWHSNYKNAPTNESAWVDEDKGEDAARVVRGGSWNYHSRYCRSAFRGYNDPRIDSSLIGFRIVCNKK